MNLYQKDNEKNMVRDSFLEKHKKIFSSIISEADNYKYDTIEFYGLILCYLNFYDYDNFSKVINELFKSKAEELFEILLIYNSHFKFHPINQDFDFFNYFIRYTIWIKDYAFFERGIKYIRDIETFIKIIEKNKDYYFKNYIKDNKDYLKYIIKLDDNLKSIKAENATPISDTNSQEEPSLTIKMGNGKETHSNTKKIQKKKLMMIKNLKKIFKIII